MTSGLRTCSLACHRPVDSDQARRLRCVVLSNSWSDLTNSRLKPRWATQRSLTSPQLIHRLCGAMSLVLATAMSCQGCTPPERDADLVTKLISARRAVWLNARIITVVPEIAGIGVVLAEAQEDNRELDIRVGDPLKLLFSRTVGDAETSALLRLTPEDVGKPRRLLVSRESTLRLWKCE